MKKIKKAILPVAGYGTRFLPATKAQPKEMLAVVDKPAIQYIVEDVVKAGIEEIIFVTGRGKRAIEDHFDYSFELDYTLVEKNKHDLVEKVRKVSNLAKFSYVRQPMPLGDGHAIACASHLIHDEPVLVVFGDMLYDYEIPPAEQLIKTYEKYSDPIVGLTEVSKDEVSKFGVYDGVDLGEGVIEVRHVVEKPKKEEATTNLVTPGIYIITPEVLEVLQQMKSGKSGEIRLIDAFEIMLQNQRPIYGKRIEGNWLDTGNKLNLIKATLQFGMKDKEIGDDLREYLKELGQKL